MVNIELTEQEQEQFIAWRKNQDTFSILLEAKAFEVKNGAAILNFDHDGILQGVSFDFIAWKRRKSNQV